MTHDSFTAPKAGALPDCATPRRAEALRFRLGLTQAASRFVAACGGTRQEQAHELTEYPRTATLDPRLTHGTAFQAYLARHREVEWMIDVFARAQGVRRGCGR